MGRYLDEHGYHPSRPIRILDMACGSGSFLIEAFDVLDRYVAEMRGHLTPRPTLSRATGEGDREGTDVHDHARQMELLTQCIYGVDKDEQAVAVARLNLLLKALHTRDRLPLLEHIRCGDSLISGAPDELRAAFGPDWREQAAVQLAGGVPGGVQADGGFDVIVGNPPYVRPETLGEAFKAYVEEPLRNHRGHRRSLRLLHRASDANAEARRLLRLHRGEQVAARQLRQAAAQLAERPAHRRDRGLRRPACVSDRDDLPVHPYPAQRRAPVPPSV